MRELVFKNLTSVNKKRRDLLISETVERNGIKTITKRHSVYIVTKHIKLEGIDGITPKNAFTPSDYNKRHIFICKKKDTRLGKDSFICDVIGRVYAIAEGEMYTIAFKHSFELDFVLVK